MRLLFGVTTGSRGCGTYTGVEWVVRAKRTASVVLGALFGAVFAGALTVMIALIVVGVRKYTTDAHPLDGLGVMIVGFIVLPVTGTLGALAGGIRTARKTRTSDTAKE